MTGLFVIICYAISALIVCILLFRYRKWSKNHTNDEISTRVINAEKPIGNGIDYIKIIYE